MQFLKEKVQKANKKINQLLPNTSSFIHFLKDEIIYRKIGNNVELNVNYSEDITIGQGGWATIATLPAGYRPPMVIAVPVALTQKNTDNLVLGKAQIMSDGVIRISQRTGMSITVSTISFSANYNVTPA